MTNPSSKAKKRLLIKAGHQTLLSSSMPQYRPSSNQKPGDQSSLTPSGKKVPMAMSMMVDSMVRMIQKANKNTSNLEDQNTTEGIDEN